MSNEDSDVSLRGMRGRGESEDRAGLVGDGGIATLEVIFSCLTNPKRRFVLYYLQDREIVTVDELAEQVAGWETETPPAEVETEHRERIAEELVHTHLPRLADALFIEYDPRSNTIRYTDPPALLDEVLRLTAQLENDSKG